MALWRAYQRALTIHPWKVQVLTAAAGGEARSAGTPDWPDPDHGLPGLWLCGPRSRRLVQGSGPPPPPHHQGRRAKEDAVGPGVLRPMFSRLFPPTGRSTQWTVRSGQLGQATAGLPRCPCHQLLPLACCAVSQLLPGPPSLQVGRCPVCRSHLELLPVLEGTPALGRPHPGACVGSAAA